MTVSSPKSVDKSSADATTIAESGMDRADTGVSMRRFEIYSNSLMSGIVGLWNRDGAPAEPCVLARLGATLRHRAADGEDRRLFGAAGLTHLHSWVTPEECGERQPLVSRRGVALALDGPIDNRDELLEALDLPRSASEAACVLAAYELWGEDFAGPLTGALVI